MLSQNKGSLSKPRSRAGAHLRRRGSSSMPTFEQRVICLTPVRTRLTRLSELVAVAQAISGFKTAADARSVKKLERAEDKERMMVRFDEEDPSGAPVSIRDRNGKSAASGAE
jgi:hypothetical protein